MERIDRDIINRLQRPFPICDRPYQAVAEELGIDEQALIDRLQAMLDQRQLSRFGPMYNAERLGGALSLCAMQVPEAEFEQVVEQVNAFPEVAHNYQREHRFNVWFVLATETPQRKQEVLALIEQQTGHRVYDMPKEREFYIGLRFDL